MQEQGFALENLFSNLMANPELLSGVLSMAGKLTQGLGLFQKEEGQNETAAERASAVETAALPAPSESRPRRHEMGKHKKLVEALMLYVGEEKRPKLELVLKILDIVELAEGLRG